MHNSKIDTNNLIRSRISIYALDNNKSRLSNIKHDNKKLENNTLSPHKEKRSNILSEQINHVNKERNIVSETKIIPIKNFTVIFI